MISVIKENMMKKLVLGIFLALIPLILFDWYQVYKNNNNPIIEYDSFNSTAFSSSLTSLDKLKILYDEIEVDNLKVITYRLRNTSNSNLENVRLTFKTKDVEMLPIKFKKSVRYGYDEDVIEEHYSKKGVYSYNIKFFDKSNDNDDNFIFKFFFVTSNENRPKLELTRGSGGFELKERKLNHNWLSSLRSIFVDAWWLFLAYFMIFVYAYNFHKVKLELKNQNIEEIFFKLKKENNVQKNDIEEINAVLMTRPNSKEINSIMFERFISSLKANTH